MLLCPDYFTSQHNPYHEDLVHAQQRLQSDADKDVRYFATQQSETELLHDHDMVGQHVSVLVSV